ncbi:MAG: TraR/DksA C4-type zinc finger protein [Opitutales bacterium]|nr:TraR/DksA C4-type zinc finger protein [Opitutales bacterium]
MKKAEKKSKPAKKTSKGGAAPKKTAASAAKKPAQKKAKVSPKTPAKTSAKSSAKNAKPAAKKQTNKKASSSASKKPAPAAKKAASKKAPAKRPQTKALPKSQTKKPAPKTAAAKKPNKVSSAKKASPQKPAAKKPEAKKASSSAAKKPAPAAKKAEAKKAPAKKPAAKISANPAAPKKREPKKVEAKKPDAKKAESKKLEDKKPAAKKQSKTASNSAEKSGPAIKSARKLSAAEVINLLKIKIPSPAKAPEAKAPAPAVRPSAGIYFSMDDLEDYFKSRAASKNEDKSARRESSASAKSPAKKAVQSRPAPAAPKKTLESASISDILGFNPIVQNKSELEEKDVPAKWKKYYRLLIEMRARFEGSPSEKIESVSANNGGLSHENSTQGMDAADIGSKSFERDMAFSLLSSEQNIISEVNAALERIRNGTYGRCEITGKPIPESRLMAIPFARCTVDGQRQKEIENKKSKSGSRSQYAVDLGGDDMPLSEMSDDSGE